MSELEVWEVQIPGTVWTRVRNHEVPNTWKTIRANGAKGPKRLQLTTEERRFNQELIPEENEHLDPFKNGALKCVQGSPKDIKTWLDDDDLTAILGLEDDALFEEEVSSIAMELTLRRLLDLAERITTVPRHAFIRDLVDERYKVGGTQRSVQEMIDAGDSLSGFRMS